MRKTIATVLRALITIGLVGALLSVIDLEGVSQVLASTDLYLLLAAVAVGWADRVIMFAKWYPLLRVQVPSIPVLRAARAYLAASFAAVFLPASIGADVLRAVALGRGSKMVPEVGASIIAERVLGLLASGIAVVVALGVAHFSSISLVYLLPWALAAVGITVVGALLPLYGPIVRVAQRWIGASRSRLLQLVARIAVAYAAYRHHRGALVAIGMVSVLEQGVPIVVFWLLARAFGTSIDLSMLVIATPLTLFAARLPITFFGNVGVFEGSMVYLLALLGVPTAEAFALAIGARVVELAGILLGAPFWPELLRHRAPGRDAAHWPAASSTAAAPSGTVA